MEIFFWGNLLFVEAHGEGCSIDAYVSLVSRFSRSICWFLLVSKVDGGWRFPFCQT